MISIGYQSFYGSSALEIVLIKECVTQIYSNAFQLCSSMRNITIPKSITYITSNAFYGCTSLQFIEGNQVYSNYENDDILYNI